MRRDSDKFDAENVELCLDLASLCADARADRAETLPADPLLALAVVALSLAMDQESLAQFLMPPEEIVEGAGRHLHGEVRRELAFRALKDVVNKTNNKGEGLI